MNGQPVLPMPERPRGRILVVGGGMTGLTAAIEAAEAGCNVMLVEREPHLGGRVAQLHQYFPKLCPPLCGLELNLRRLRAGQRLECLTLTQVLDVAESCDGLRVTMRQHPRFVTQQCTACGACAKVCPVKRENSFDYAMSGTEAIYLPFATSHPALYAIDASACPGASCALCVKECPVDAIDLSMSARDFEMNFDAIIWATGWRPYEPSALQDLGFGSHPDIITNVMMERLASPQGPTGGRIVCPSDGRVPKRVAFVQCAGSRDESHLEYCSGVCCLASAKQARYVREASPDIDITIHYIDRRATGNYERFLVDTADDAKIRFVLGKVAKINVQGGSPVLEFEDVAANRRAAQAADLVVLATGMVPECDDTAACRNLERDSNGFIMDSQRGSRQFSAGCARQPMDVATSARDATSAVAKALATCPLR